MSRTIFTLVRITLCGLFVLCAMITANAQFRAGVQGTISDSAGALVPDAKVVLKDTETGKTQEATTNRGRLLSHHWPGSGKIRVNGREGWLQEKCLAKP